MRMSIDDAKEWLKLAVPIKALTPEEFETFIQSVNLAVETMRKYQQIKDIVSVNGEEFKQCGLKELKEILEVIKDGKID